MAIRDELIFDAWTPMSFKRVLGNRRVAAQTWMAPTWVGDHGRRLQAYKILQSYIDNASRFFLQEADEGKRDAHREYGDANLIVQTVMAALLGEDQQIVVPGAEDWDPDKNQVVEDHPNAEEARQRWELQEWLRTQAIDERLGLKMIETERNAVGLGDGVYVLGNSTEKGRVRLRVFDPGFYFPVLGDGNEDEYPDRIHVAWELLTDSPNIHKVRRITWDLRDLPIGETRNYPWNDKPSHKSCYMSDGTWTLEVGNPVGPDDFSGGTVEWATYLASDGTVQEFKDVDLQIDFIPAVHLPNNVAILNHYGRSILSTILQILDDISNADTDLNAASGTTGTPPIVLKGATLGKTAPTYGPGKVWEVGADGGLDVLDTSSALDALLKYIEALLQRLSVNARVPESVLGRVKVDGQLAGITLALSFGPLGALIKEMRLVRDEKYPLLLKFWWRMAKAAGYEGVPEVWFDDTHLEFGSYLPQDTSAAVDMVTKLLTVDPPAVSIETAVRILVNGGLPIDSALDEVQRITGRAFKQAVELLDATGDEKAVFEFLGRTMPTDVVPRPTAPVIKPTGPIPPGGAPAPTNQPGA